MTQKELTEVLNLHQQWLCDTQNGERADLRNANLRNADLRNADLRYASLLGTDLRGADLRHADLRHADLQGADLRHTDLRHANLRGASLQGTDLRGTNLDYSCWPLWCGSIGVRVSPRLARQLVYHAFAVECNDPEFLRLKETCADFANEFKQVRLCTVKPIGEGAKLVDTVEKLAHIVQDIAEEIRCLPDVNLPESTSDWYERIKDVQKAAEAIRNNL